MRIDRVTIRNFRCFAERAFDFNPSFNLLVGENGSGKTAVLEALSVAVGSWFLGIRGYGERHLRRDDARLVVFRSGSEWNLEPTYPVEVEADGQVDGEQIQWKRTLVTPRGRTTSNGATQIKQSAASADERVREGEPVVLPLVAYYGTGRLWLQPRERSARSIETRKQELSRFEGYRDAIDPRCSPRDLVRWIQRQDYAAYQERRESDLYRVVKNAMVGMVEHARDLRYDPRRGDVVVSFDDRDPQPFDNLSDGQRNILALAGDIAVRMARLNIHLGERALAETPGVVLIDELDLHLHPTWQRHLVEDLRNTFPRIQFIATSHSPFVIQTLRPGELIILDDNQPVIDPGNLGIEEIAEGLMGVEQPEVSPRYLEMKEAAREYLTTLDEAVADPTEPLETYEARLAENIKPYADNPAFQAFLEMRRVATLGEPGE
jgi:predicted ATP-binding protein involved in virulence